MISPNNYYSDQGNLYKSLKLYRNPSLDELNRGTKLSYIEEKSFEESHNEEWVSMGFNTNNGDPQSSP